MISVQALSPSVLGFSILVAGKIFLNNPPGRDLKAPKTH